MDVYPCLFLLTIRPGVFTVTNGFSQQGIAARVTAAENLIHTPACSP